MSNSFIDLLTEEPERKQTPAKTASQFAPFSNQVRKENLIVNNQEISITPPVITDEAQISLSRDYKKELENIAVDKVINDWLTFRFRENISVTTAIMCPVQMWMRGTGKLTKEHLETDKIFTALPLYSYIGDVVHQYVYDILKIDKSKHETKLIDNKEKISGKFDIIDNGVLIDIKTSIRERDNSPQLAMYYHLCKVNNIKIKTAKIWYVLQSKMVEYDLKELDSLIPVYLSWAQELRRSINNNTLPRIFNNKDCQYCLIEKLCNERLRYPYVNR